MEERENKTTYRIAYHLDKIEELPLRISIFLDMFPVGYYNTDISYSWNPDDCSENMYVKTDNNFICHRNPSMNTTDAVRGKTVFTKGIHVWEIFWPIKSRKSHASIGVATAKQPLIAEEYNCLIGSSEESWGWDLVSNNLHHGNDEVKKYPANLNKNEKLRIPEQILVILNMEEGTLSYAIESAYLGVAFKGLCGLSLYPAISTVCGHGEITIKYIGANNCSPFPLEIICKHTLRFNEQLVSEYINMSRNINALLRQINSWYIWVIVKRYPEYMD